MQSGLHPNPNSILRDTSPETQGQKIYQQKKTLRIAFLDIKLSFWIFLEIRCDDAGIINYYLFIYIFMTGCHRQSGFESSVKQIFQYNKYFSFLPFIHQAQDKSGSPSKKAHSTGTSRICVL